MILTEKNYFYFRTVLLLYSFSLF